LQRQKNHLQDEAIILGQQKK